MIYISENANSALISYLEQLDNIRIIHGTDKVYSQVSAHPDIYMCSLGDKVIHADMDEIGFMYPQCCAFNAACTGKYLIGNLNILSERLLNEAASMEKIHVKQGYSKCNVAIIDENFIITSDMGIYKSCCERLNVLKISESTRENPMIKLKGFDYGFIGGSCGRIGDEIIFHGRISDHADFDKIYKFISERGLTIREFDFPLEDIGSIIQEVDS